MATKPKAKTNPQVALFDKAVRGVISRLEKTEKFVLEQAPDLAKDMILEQEIERTRDIKLNLSIAAILIPAAVAMVMLSVWGSSTNFITSGEYHTHNNSDAAAFFGGIFAAISFVFALFNLSAAYRNWETLVYVRTTPKLFLLRSFKELLE